MLCLQDALSSDPYLSSCIAMRFVFPMLFLLAAVLVGSAALGAELASLGEVPHRLPPVDETEVSTSNPALPQSPISLVAYQQPLARMRLGFGGRNRMSVFRDAGLDQSSRTRLGNNFVADPDFEGGIVMTGQDIALKIGGYVKADFIHDFDAIDQTDSFDTTTILTDSSERENSRFHARQSRLSFDARWLVDDRVVRTFIEADFFGNTTTSASAFRLRHAYGRIGRFTAGQTWTTFTDPSAVPQTLDVEGAVSNVNRRQALARWDQPLLDGSLLFAAALEDPNVVIESPTMLAGEARTDTPDFITRLRVEPEWGEFQVASIIRQLGFQPTGMPEISETAWGFNFTGSALMLPGTKAYYQFTFGEGIGSYRGSPDVVATGPMTGEIVPVLGWLVGLKHEWNDRLSSNVTISEVTLDDFPGQDPASLKDTTYLAVNLIQNPFERVFWGIEYLYGVRQDVSGDEGSANRLQVSCGFFLP